MRASLQMNIFRALVHRFVAWNHRPVDRTRDEVARLIQDAIEGTVTHRAMDWFISIDITDPTLNEVKDEVALLYGPEWEDDWTRERLKALLRRVQELPT